MFELEKLVIIKHEGWEVWVKHFHCSCVASFPGLPSYRVHFTWCDRCACGNSPLLQSPVRNDRAAYNVHGSREGLGTRLCSCISCLLDKSLLQRVFSIVSFIGGSTVFVTSDASMVRKAFYLVHLVFMPSIVIGGGGGGINC